MKPQGTQNRIYQTSISANDQHIERKKTFRYSRQLYHMEIKTHTEKIKTLESRFMEIHTKQTLL